MIDEPAGTGLHHLRMRGGWMGCGSDGVKMAAHLSRAESASSFLARMQSLVPPDVHHLSAAIGWVELGNAREARAELDKLTPALAGHPEVLEVRWIIAAAERDWSAALDAAERLVETDPARASGWLHRAYALRRVEGGGLSAAWDALLPAVHRFPREATIPYNLACYACQMGQVDEARAWLLRARSVGDKARIKQMALADDDLKLFWPEVSHW